MTAARNVGFEGHAVAGLTRPARASLQAAPGHPPLTYGVAPLVSLTVIVRETALRNLARVRGEDKDLFTRTRRAISAGSSPRPLGSQGRMWRPDRAGAWAFAAITGTTHPDEQGRSLII